MNIVNEIDDDEETHFLSFLRFLRSFERRSWVWEAC